MTQWLPTIKSPRDLRALTEAQLVDLAAEIREELCQPLRSRSAHFASNLGVVELCLALHTVFDFERDRLIWDTGHQIYPHKMITGRYDRFRTIRTKGGLMGFPNPAESDFDLFVTGHAGCSVSSALGLRVADVLRGQDDRHSVAVIGDGAFPSGIVYEAMNNAAGLNSDLIVVLNDNRMSICPRVGGLSTMLERSRETVDTDAIKRQVEQLIAAGDANDHDAWQQTLRDAIRSGMVGSLFFEEMGFQYVGPVDGHDIAALRHELAKVKSFRGPVLVHVLTVKGHGIECASADPVTFHTPPVFEAIADGQIALKPVKSVAYTNLFSDAIYQAMVNNPLVTVMTAAMCQGTKLQKVRDDFSARFFDTGICESHAVAFASGMAKAGIRPIVAIYSTFLQRSFDQIFQEVALQNLPVTFCLDRAGFTGPEGPTHHGVFDITYMRLFPHMVVMAPGDQADVKPMLDFALQHAGPVSIRYPKCTPASVARDVAPVRLGRAEVLDWGSDGCLIAFGSLFGEAVEAAARLRELGHDIGVINARFAKPLDKETILKAVRELPFVVTIEEGTIEGGFGSAVLEAVNEAGLSAKNIRRLAIPDRFVLHAEREEQLAEVGLDVNGIVQTVLELAEGPLANAATPTIDHHWAQNGHPVAHQA